MEEGTPSIGAEALCSSTSSKVGGGVLQQLGATPAYTTTLQTSKHVVLGNKQNDKKNANEKKTEQLSYLKEA